MESRRVACWVPFYFLFILMIQFQLGSKIQNDTFKTQEYDINNTIYLVIKRLGQINLTKTNYTNSNNILLSLQIKWKEFNINERSKPKFFGISLGILFYLWVCYFIIFMGINKQ